MRKVFLVGVSTLLRFAGQFLFVKSISHLSESSILATLNLQSLSVLLAGFSSGGIQTYLSKYIALEKLRTAWELGFKKSSIYFLYALMTILPCYLIINSLQDQLIPLIGIVFLSLGLSYSNNWQGLLTGQKKYSELITIFFIQFLIFLLLYKFGYALSDGVFFLAYPATIIVSVLISYFINRSIIAHSDAIVNVVEVVSDIKSHRLMGIVLMTAGVAYPFIIRNLLSSHLSLTDVVNWDYILRISTAYTSVSSFFLFTLFASDSSRTGSNISKLGLASLTLLIPYLTIFSLLNPAIFKLLLSRDFSIDSYALVTFIGYEIIKAVFSTTSLIFIVKGKNNRYITMEILNLFLSGLIIYTVSPRSISESFVVLGSCFGLAFVIELFVSKILFWAKTKKQQQTTNGKK